jgi:RsiW-degrading membrane proteinase PrsW (M82 family)
LYGKKEGITSVSLDNQGQAADSEGPKRQPTSELWGPWEAGHEVEQQPPIASGTLFKRPMGSATPAEPDPQFTHREHVSGSLLPDPSEAPLFRPAYPPYPGYQPYDQVPGNALQGQGHSLYPPFAGYPPQRQGYPPSPGYPSYQGYVSPPPGAYAPLAPPPYARYDGYPAYGYGYPWQPPQPKRDGYLFGVAISSLICSSLLLLAGLGSLGLLALLAIVPSTNLSKSEYFAGVMLFIGFTGAGIVGGGFGLYHSIRSAFLRKPSADFALPQFWIFVLLYAAVIGIAYLLQKQGLAVTYPVVTAVLILLSGIFPALAVLALGDRRLHFPRSSSWPTSWRRFTLALVSGATLSVGLALLLEFVFQALLVQGQAVNPLLCIDRPNAPNCQNPGVYNLILLVVAVIAPLIEEAVKPIAVVVLIGRIRSAAEAFVLGLACGIGFDLIETTGYISYGYQDWLNIALIRTGSGLLHGFGAAMVALGWYYLTRPGKHRLLKTSACWLYAVAQHALWNGSWGLALLPAPIGPFFDKLNVTIGPVSLASYEMINIAEAVLILVFFIYMTGRLRTKTTLPLSSPPEKRETQSVGEPQRALPR